MVKILWMQIHSRQQVLVDLPNFEITPSHKKGKEIGIMSRINIRNNKTFEN